MNTINLEEFGKRITELRESSGNSQEEICVKLGVTQQTLSRYEKGQRQASLDFVVKASRYFNVSADYLLGITDVKSTNKDIQYIHKYTGLNENSISTLKFFNSIPFQPEFYHFDEINTINLLLGQEHSSYSINNFFYNVLADGSNNILKIITNIINLKYIKSDKLIIDESGEIEKYNPIEHGVFHSKIMSINTDELLDTLLFDKLKQSIVELRKSLKEESDNAQHNPKKE